MLNIRRNTFETNSSSTHSMVIAMKDDFDKWVNRETLYCKDSYSWKKNKFEEGKFYNLNEVNTYIVENNPEYTNNPEELYGDYGLCTYESFCDDLETDQNTFTTPNGEVIKTICRFGYDG